MRFEPPSTFGNPSKGRGRAGGIEPPVHLWKPVKRWRERRFLNTLPPLAHSWRSFIYRDPILRASIYKALYVRSLYIHMYRARVHRALHIEPYIYRALYIGPICRALYIGALYIGSLYIYTCIQPYIYRALSIGLYIEALYIRSTGLVTS